MKKICDKHVKNFENVYALLNLKDKKTDKGITLIALIVTIIILLILAGVSLSLIGGGNGILNRASHAVDQNKIATAKEQVELKVAEFGADFYQEKYVERINDGTKKEYISNQLKQGQQTQDFYAQAFENDTVKVYEGDELVVTGVILEDGSILWDEEIIDGLENEKIQIVATQTVTSDYVKGSLQAEITYHGTLSQITVNGKEVTARVGENGIYIIEYEVTENGSYTIMARDENGDYQKEIVKVTDITEDMEIWNRADMESFRDKVNSGRTFEGKTARVMADIDLEGSEENQWVPVVNYAVNRNLIFKGTFEGNGHTIGNVYINSTNHYQALFGMNYGTIQNVKIEGSIKSSGGNVAGVTGYNYGVISKCWNDAYIQSNIDIAGGIAGYNQNGTIEKCYNTGEIYSRVGNIGGIVGSQYAGGSIKECFNEAYVHAGDQTAGGIVGYLSAGNVYNCYNTGKIQVNSHNVGGINGAAGRSGYSTAYTFNCYNLGSVLGNSRIGSITGWPNANSGSSQNINCYTTNATVELLNAGQHSENVWTEDIGINNGYPILKWQVEK